MTRVLILGGYGAVGRQAAAALVAHVPGAEVVVAGRNPGSAKPVPAATMVRVDVSDASALTGALRDVDVVLMCAERENAKVARACLERGVHYLDVSATHQVLAELEKLDDLARRNGATAALSVGLAPGVTNLLARHCVERSATREVRIGVLLGSGEQHGVAAVGWTLDGLGRLDGTWTAPFPAPYGPRTVHRFPFSDQYTLPATLGIETASTGLCLDSRLVTAMLGAARRPAIGRLLRHARVRGIVLAAMTRIHVGSDGFAVSVTSGTVRATLSGRMESRATGLTAALLIRDLPALPPGVAHIEQLVDPVAFLTDLATYGFLLDLVA